MDIDCSWSCWRCPYRRYWSWRRSYCSRRNKHCRKNWHPNRCFRSWRCSWRRSFKAYQLCLNRRNNFWEGNWESYAFRIFIWSGWKWNGLTWRHGRQRDSHEVLVISIRVDSIIDKISSWYYLRRCNQRFNGHHNKGY